MDGMNDGGDSPIYRMTELYHSFEHPRAQRLYMLISAFIFMSGLVLILINVSAGLIVSNLSVFFMLVSFYWPFFLVRREYLRSLPDGIVLGPVLSMTSVAGIIYFGAEMFSVLIHTST